MKVQFIKVLGMLLVMMLAAAGGVLARGGRHRHEDGPARREVRAYFQANVLPTLRQQRQKLEPQLEAADRALLATYRTQLKALKEQGKALRKTAAPATESGRPTLNDAQRQQAQQLRAQARDIMQHVAQLVQKYRAPLTQALQELQPQKEKWAADIKAIRSRNATPEQQQHLVANEGRRDGVARLVRPAMFLLLDPNAPAEPAAPSLGRTAVYPNPVAATSQLEFEVKKAGPVTVELLDKNGSQLRTLLQEPKADKGPHTQQLNLSDLPAGTYYYKITTKSGTETKRFVKE